MCCNESISTFNGPGANVSSTPGHGDSPGGGFPTNLRYTYKLN